MTPQTPQIPFIRLIDMWFDAASTLLSAQRSLITFAVETPLTGLARLSERLTSQTANERMPTLVPTPSS